MRAGLNLVAYPKCILSFFICIHKRVSSRGRLVFIYFSQLWVKECGWLQFRFSKLYVKTSRAMAAHSVCQKIVLGNAWTKDLRVQSCENLVRKAMIRKIRITLSVQTKTLSNHPISFLGRKMKIMPRIAIRSMIFCIRF